MRSAVQEVGLSLCAATLVLAGFSPSLMAATGEKSAAKASASQVAAAEALFAEGRALVLQGRAPEACRKFEQSQGLDPGLGTQFNLADCYERVGKLASAHALFKDVAATARRTGQARREQVALERAGAVQPRLTKLAIVVPAGRGAELRVERDGAEVSRAEWDVPVAVDPGLHRVRASGPGLRDWATEVTVPSDGGVHRVAIPVGEAVSFFDPLQRKLGLAAAGVGVLGVSLGSFFGVRAIMKRNEANRTGCEGRECSTDESVALRDAARRSGDIATVTMSVGAAGLATAAVLFWVVPEPGPDGPEPDRHVARLVLRPVVGLHGGGLSLRGGF
jgi:hypothetical protein